MIKWFFLCKTRIYSPCDGEVLSLKLLNDQIFCEGRLGEGVMIEPDGDEVTLYAPISGVISAINETNHALIISNKNVSVLLHIGTQTTQLQGQGIDLLVKQNQKVRKRQALLKLNLAYLQSHLDFAGIIMVVIPESKRHRLSQIKYGKIQKKQLIFKASK